MSNIYETLENNYIVYEKKMIHVLIDDDDKVWFNTKDVLIALGYRDYKNASKRLINRKYVRSRISINISKEKKIGQPYSLYMNESGLYRLMTKSKLPKAERFTDWIFDDLLPKIRKFGKYKLKQNCNGHVMDT